MALPDIVRIWNGLIRQQMTAWTPGRIRPALTQSNLGPQGNLVFRGGGYIAGVVTVEGAAASRPVRLYERTTGALIAKTRSAADGTYRFDGVSPDAQFLVLAFDDSNVYNAAPADRIDPATG